MQCSHANTEPVSPAGSDQEVAEVCVDCLASLPLGYSCDDCEHEEIRTLCGPSQRIVTDPCVRHSGL